MGEGASKARWLLVAAVLWALITAFRFLVANPAEPIAFLYVVPITLAGAIAGLMGGVAMATMSFGAFVVWGLIVDAAVDPLGYLVRGVGLFTAGGWVGWLAGQRGVIEQRSRRWFEMSNDMLCEASLEGYFTRLNDQWERCLGYSAEELMGQPYVAFIHPDDVESTARASAELAEGPSEVVNFENRYRAKDGRWHWLLWSSRSDGHRIYAVAKDITERKEMQDQFVSSVSHELRTPLTAIRGYLEALLDNELGPLDPEQREYLEVVHRNAHRLSGLISDLLLLSRLESDGVELHPAPVSLGTLVKDVVEEFKLTADAKGVVLSFKDGMARICGDEARLRQAIGNLITNAIKFTPAGKAVWVAVGQVGSEAWVEVRDEGVGIPPQEIPRLFSRFFRASTAGVIEGTGLGLTITQEIVARHGGHIGVQSQPDEGSTFRIVLPLDGGPPE